MKKTILFSILLSIFMLVDGFSATIINGAYVNGLFRGAVAQKTNLVTSRFTNSLAWDIVLVTMPQNAYPSGFYQSRVIRLNRQMSNWILVAPTLATNSVGGILSIAKFSNVVLANMTNALHGVVTTEGMSRTNKLHLILTNITLNRVQTNAFSLGILKSSTNGSRAQIKTATNALDIKLGADDVFYTNALHLQFTNVLSVQNTNRICVRNYDRLTNWLLYVSNQQVKVKKK